MTTAGEQEAGSDRAWLIRTDKAQCRDCYRCIRVCPVKAIRMEHGQATIVPERCVLCGACIRECPQHARTHRNDIGTALALLRSGRRVAASVAPAFAAEFSEWEQRRLPAALRMLGFDFVGETAAGAELVAGHTASLLRTAAAPSLGVSCPAVLRLAELYHPNALTHILPVCSPMIAHATALRQHLGEDVVVMFIGPCIAKKWEAEREEYRDVVNCVLTFGEIRDLLSEQGIDLNCLEESMFDDAPRGKGRLYPLPGGMTACMHGTADVPEPATMALSGAEDVRTMFADLAGMRGVRHIEALFCAHGCVDGAGGALAPGLLDRIAGVSRHAGSRIIHDALRYADMPLPAPALRVQAPQEKAVTESALREMLSRIGKARPEDELNCGACGYGSCREKAAAVLQGMAEVDMCMPHMRRRAEQRSDRIIESTPNGIVILDEHFTILSVNPAFQRMFMCSDAICGRRISYLMDPAPFEQVATGSAERIDHTVRHERYGLTTRQIVYCLRDARQYVGIFVNITKNTADEARLRELRSRTVEQARELLAHQIETAQNITALLGESAARGEALVEHLLDLVQDNASGREVEIWQRSTATPS